MLAARHALAVAGIGVADLATIDLYSCFPIAVFNICDGLGLAPDDPRGLTLTGGLPFFGGAGNNYSMHAIAETVQRARQAPGTFGFVGANGGIHEQVLRRRLLDQAGRVARPTAAPTCRPRSTGWAAPAQARQAEGWAVIETFTVTHARDGAAAGIVIGRLEAGGERFAARAADGDREMLDLLTTADQPVGQRVYVRPADTGNLASASG